MYKATITATLAVLAIALLGSGRAEAGGSASAPSKYGHTSQVAAVNHTIGRCEEPISRLPNIPRRL
jgi:hypothetical protein